MIVKIFANKGGGSAGASIDYLLGKDRQREGAKVLSGDPELSKSIAESLEFKNRYTVGCLSFEEREISSQAKKEIMEKFEKTIFAGMEKDQYNITWIEHSDKNRVELNFFIPNVELRTDKRLQPYYDRADRPLTDNFQTVINHEYGLSDPHDFEKKQLLKIDLDTPKPVAEFKKDVHELILDHVAKGEIKSQENLVEIFTNAGLEVSRTTGKSISIKNPDGGRNIRFDGELYGKEFYEQTRTLEEFKEYVGREQSGKLETDGADHERNYQRAIGELGEAVARRTERHQKLYPEQNRIECDIHSHNHDDDRNMAVWGMADQSTTRNITEIEDNGSELQRIRAIYQPRPDTTEQGRGRNDLHNKQVEESRSLQEQQLHSNTETHRIGLFLHELSRRAKDAIQNARDRITAFTERFREIQEHSNQSDVRDQKIVEIERGIIDRKREVVGLGAAVENHERISTREQQQIISEQRSIGEAKQSINDCFKQTERTDREFGETVEAVDKAVIKQEQKQSRGWSMSR